MDTQKPSSSPSTSGTATGSTPGSSAAPGQKMMNEDSIRGALDQAKRQVDEVASDVKETAADLAQQAREAAAQAASEGARKASRFAESQKGMAADQIAKVSEAAHVAADHLNEASPQMARYAHELASGIDRFAGTMRERSLGDLMRQATDFARRDPAVFMAGSVLVGFMLTRFLKSSAERAERERFGDQGGREYGGFGQSYGDDRERRMGTGGAERFRNATQGPGSMPGQTGSGRSYDPSRRYDERDTMPGQSRGAGMGASAGQGSAGMGGTSSPGGRSGTAGSSPDGLSSSSGRGAGTTGVGASSGREFTGGSSAVGTGGAGGSTVRPGSAGENVQPDLTRGGSHG